MSAYYTTSRFTLNNNPLVQLIIINLVFFIIFQLVKVFFLFNLVENVARERFFSDIMVNLAIPGNFGEFIRKPWTLITHMVYHDGVWHILGNMLWLWMFGSIFQELTGGRKIIPLFFYGALGGAIAYLLAFNLAPTLAAKTSYALGASGGIMAIVAATTMIAPDYRLFPMLGGGIPLWAITVLFLLIDLSLMANLENTGGHIAHIAGGITGLLFVFSMRRGYDWSDGMNNFFDWLNDLFNPDKPKKKIRGELFYKSRRAPFSKTPNLTQQRIDDILDKISQKGYHSLTNEEKELLKRASKEDL